MGPTKNNLGSSRIVAGWLWIHLRRARTGARETVLPGNHSQLQVPSVRQDLNTALPSGRGEQAALDLFQRIMILGCLQQKPSLPGC